MGGFTEIKLADCSQANVNKQNKILRELGVPKKYKFYSEADVVEEYAWYLRGDGVYPDHLFPKDKIGSLNDFKRYWSTKALGVVFVPEFGMLTFDCYFGRTSKKAMTAIGKYVIQHINEIQSVGGSFETFLERAMSERNAKRVMKLLGENVW